MEADILSASDEEPDSRTHLESSLVVAAPQSSALKTPNVEVDEDVESRPDEAEASMYFEQFGGHEDSGAHYPSLPRGYRSTRTYDEETFNTSTRSLYDGDLEYHVENGRRYVQDYFMPNDDDEQSRLQIMHQVFLSLFDSRLTTVPLSDPTKILDIGTGTGEWAIGMGETYPDSEVIGTDLSAIQPSAVPSNVFFEICDVEEFSDWTEPAGSCDLIHFRIMGGAFHSWDLIYQRAFTHLKPGGWIEVLDFDDTHSSYTSHWSEDSKIISWYRTLGDAMRIMGRDIKPVHLNAERLTDIGYVEVEVKDYEIPIGAWPTDPDVKITAKLWLIIMLEGFEALSLRPLTRNLGWSAEEVKRLCGLAQAELRGVAVDGDQIEGLSMKVKVLTGRKPMEGEPLTREDVTSLGMNEYQDITSDTHDDYRPEADAATRNLRPPFENADRVSEGTVTPERRHAALEEAATD